jgi:hypothetical protein
MLVKPNMVFQRDPLDSLQRVCPRIEENLILSAFTIEFEQSAYPYAKLLKQGIQR